MKYFVWRNEEMNKSEIKEETEQDTCLIKGCNNQTVNTFCSIECHKRAKGEYWVKKQKTK